MQNILKNKPHGLFKHRFINYKHYLIIFTHQQHKEEEKELLNSESKHEESTRHHFLVDAEIRCSQRHQRC